MKADDKNLEIFDLAGASSLYTLSLIGLFNNSQREFSEKRIGFEKYAETLRRHLIRCNLQAEIPTLFSCQQDVVAFLENGGVISDIGDKLAGTYSPKEEYLFLFICNLSLLATDTENSEINLVSLRSNTKSIGERAGLPDHLVDHLLTSPESSITELRSYLRSASHPSKPAHFWERYGREIFIGVIVTILAAVLLGLLNI